MRTTIRLEDGLMAALRRLAAETERTLTAVIEDTLREALARRGASGPRRRIRLPTFKGRGTMPGVDLDRSSDLLDLMERSRDPR